MRISLFLRPSEQNKIYSMAKKNQNDEPLVVDLGEGYTKMEHFVNDNRQALTYGLGGLAVLILAALGYQSFVAGPAESQAEEEAWRAENYFQMDSLDLAEFGDGYDAGLEEILNHHSGTDAASRASYELGIIYRDGGRFEEAIEAFKTAGLVDDVIGALSEGNVGDCLIELGRYNEAIGHFESAAALGASSLAENVLTPMFLYKSGITKMETGDFAGAKSDFSRIVTDYPECQQFNSAVGMKASLANS